MTARPDEAIRLASDSVGEDRAGAGPLVVAHGLFGSKRNWATMARRFSEAGRVITLDMRNHGDSPRAPAMDYRAMGGDILATIDAEAGGRARLLGHSMGGKASMAAALMRPEAVSALVVVDVAPVAYDHPEHAGIVRAMLESDLSGVTRRSEVEPALAGAAPDPALRAFLMQNLVIETTDAGKAARWKPDLAAIEAALGDLTEWPRALGDARYEGPVLVIAGATSPYVDARGESAIRTLFPNAEIARLDAGHWPHAETPDAFFTAVSDWLRALAPGQDS